MTDASGSLVASFEYDKAYSRKINEHNPYGIEIPFQFDGRDGTMTATYGDASPQALVLQVYSSSRISIGNLAPILAPKVLCCYINGHGEEGTCPADGGPEEECNHCESSVLTNSKKTNLVDIILHDRNSPWDTPECCDETCDCILQEAEYNGWMANEGLPEAKRLFNSTINKSHRPLITAHWKRKSDDSGYWGNYTDWYDRSSYHQEYSSNEEWMQAVNQAYDDAMEISRQKLEKLCNKLKSLGCSKTSKWCIQNRDR
jgi:hypothetical protein